MSYDKLLAASLESLPIDMGKVLLWLVYRDLKPMASICTSFDWDSNENKKDKEQIKNWLNKAGLVFCVSQKFGNTLHVSKTQANLDLNREFELGDTQKAHQVRGELYGFPKEAAALFPSNKLIHPASSNELLKLSWYPYVEYLVRIGNEKEDSAPAKAWADTARAEIPDLAREYEENRIKDLEKLRRAY